MAIICQCEVVRERTIAKVIRQGADTVEAVQAACGAGTMCGGCIPSIEALIAEHRDPSRATRASRVLERAR